VDRAVKANKTRRKGRLGGWFTGNGSAVNARGSSVRCDLAVAFDQEFVGAELTEAHGAAGVEAVGADADFGAVAKFKAIGEARAGVPVNGGAVDGREEAAGGGFVGGDDGVAVVGAVAVDRSLMAVSSESTTRMAMM